MASGIKCTVAFKRFKWNRPGYAEVMNSSGVQSILSGKASRLASSCNSSFKPEHGEGDGYELKRVRGTLANGYVVKTATLHAIHSECRHNRLLGGLGSIGGE